MRNSFFLAAGAALLLVFPAGTAGRPQGEVVNCLAAVVNGEVVTLVDVRVAEMFGLAEALDLRNAADPRRAILETLIDRKVVIDLAGERATFDPALVQAEMDRMAARFGAEGLRKRLEPFGLIFEDLRPFVEEKVKAQTIVANRFGRSVTVGLKEIEAAYRETYVPAETKAGRSPRPLIEMIETIESGLRAEKIREQSALWVLNLRDQADIEVRPDCLKREPAAGAADRR
ncbi:MAG: hypothetical protein FJY80_05570 [Candidatus Aminicenantes bacterium]|nr:hypothetical protein [Candidatus Aminicenantes bacterium]